MSYVVKIKGVVEREKCLVLLNVIESFSNMRI